MNDLLLVFLAFGYRCGWDEAEAEGCLAVDQALEDYANAHQKGYRRGLADGRTAAEADAKMFGASAPTPAPAPTAPPMADLDAALTALARQLTSEVAALFPGLEDDPDAFILRAARMQHEHGTREGAE